MRKLAERGHITHEGEKGVYERTDPDYVDKRLARLVQDYRNCPAEWRETFLAGLSTEEYRFVTSA